MEWFKRHVDTLIILGGILLWMSGKFGEIEKELFKLDKEISVIKAVMIIKHILPPDLAVNEGEK